MARGNEARLCGDGPVRARDHSAGTHVRAYDFIGEQHPLALRGCRRRTIRDSVRSDKRTECAMGAIVRGAGAHTQKH